MEKSWNKDFALLWTKTVGPSRPSISELNIYTEVAHKLENKLKRKIDILILGSTTEFRDWAYEENFNITVIDKNYEYYNEISKYLKHKDVMSIEKVVVCKWEDMDFKNEFDIIIGDLAIGNIPKDKLEVFIERVKKALKNNGLFLGKSYFIPNNYIKILPKEIARNYSLTKCCYNPFSYMIFDLVMYSVNQNSIIDFNILYSELLKLRDSKLINNEILKKFAEIELEAKIDFQFHVPTIVEYEILIKKHFNIKDIRYGLDIYSKNFPIYIIEKVN